MDLTELIKQQGIEIPKDSATETPIVGNLKKKPLRRPWLDEVDVSQALDSHQSGVRQTLDTRSLQASPVSQTLDSRESDVRETLDKQEFSVSQALDSHQSGVRQTLDTTLDRCETAVSKNTNEALEISHLTGHEKTLVLYICEECRKIGSLETNYLSNEEINFKIPIDSNGLRNLIHRVKQKGFFTVKTKSLGKTAIRKFMIPKFIYQQSPVNPLDSRESDVSQTLGKALGKALETTLSSSVLESIKLQTEETKSHRSDQLPDDWKEIDFSCLASVRFTENHLLQIYQCGKASPEMTQESIYEIHHDLTINNNKTLRNPRNVLLSLLKKGTPYTSPGYISEEVLAEKKCLEELKRRNQELLKLKEEQERLKNAPVEFEKSVKFQTWLSALTQEQKRKLAPHATVDGGEMQIGLLRAHFEQLTNT